MAQTSLSNMQEMEIMEAQLRECYGRVVYAHKTQEKCADICLSKLNTIKLFQIFLSVVTTGSFLVNLIGTGKTSIIIGAICSAALLGINLYTKNFDLGKAAQKHKDAADKLWDARESYLSLLTDIRANSITITEVKKLRDRLQKMLSSTYACAPRTHSKAYKQAQKALKINEDMTFSNAEIDAFLPNALHKRKE